MKHTSTGRAFKLLPYFFSIICFLCSGPAHASFNLWGAAGSSNARGTNVGLFAGEDSNEQDSTSLLTAPSRLTYGGGFGIGFLGLVEMRFGYFHMDADEEKGTVAFSTGGGGSSLANLNSDSIGGDILLRVISPFYFGFGVFYTTTNATLAYSLTNPGKTVKDATLEASGSGMGERAILGFEIPFGPLAFFAEGQYQVLKITELKAKSRFNYSKDDTNPNTEIKSGQVVRHWSNATPNGFRGSNVELDFTGPVILGGLSLSF